MHPSLMILPLGAHLFVRTAPRPSSTTAVAATVVQLAAFIMLWSVSLSCCETDVWPAGIILYAIATSALVLHNYRFAWVPAALLWGWYGTTLLDCNCPSTALWATPYGVILATILVLATQKDNTSLLKPE